MIAGARVFKRKGARNRVRLTHRQAEALTGFTMAAPWIIGFFVFVAGPMIASLYLAIDRCSRQAPFRCFPR